MTINNRSCLWDVATEGSTLDFLLPTAGLIQQFWLFNSVFSFAAAAGQGLKRYYSC